MDEVSLSTLFIAWNNIWPVVVNSIIIFLAFLSGKAFATHIYKYNIKYFLSNITKEEIEKRDKKIKKLIESNIIYKAENGKLKNHLDVVRKVVGELDE